MFKAFRLGRLTMPNRVVMAPMTRSRVGEGDVPTPMNAEYYAQRASSGLIVSEAITVASEARGYLFTPGLYSAEQVAGWKAVTEAVHDSGGRVFAQLWHVGRVSHVSVLPAGHVPLSSTDEFVSGLETFGWVREGRPGKVAVSPPRAMTTVDIDRMVEQFASAAANAVVAGFDGVEILAGNGYLFEQYLNSGCNTRVDEYGGQSPESRSRLLLCTLDAIRSRLGAEFPIAVRLSPFGHFNSMPPDPHVEETYLYLASQLRGREIAYVHFNDEPVSIGHLNGETQQGAQLTPPWPGVPQRLISDLFLREFKSAFNGPMMLCGGLDGATAQRFLDSGLVDLVAFGVPYLANPDLPERLRNRWPLNEPKTDLFYGGDERGYVDYPVYQVATAQGDGSCRT